MSRHRLTVGLLAALALTGTLGMGTAQASAPPTRTPHQATRPDTAYAPPGWVLRGKYWTRGGCTEAGQEGVQRHHWDEFQCANGPVRWILWTNR
ncbi:hypothetical protein Spla01_04730 [Streptomyces platensis]|uniref:Secreted protein n=2 Tax=Streptomyces platensis TaxID=58346 RepID=A0ABX3XZB3_STRPT|nr:hypothetical protein [Streptomyces platensis]OSY46173.1 hypothetical protein BG653_02409 [Streptomyces platensis]